MLPAIAWYKFAKDPKIRRAGWTSGKSDIFCGPATRNFHQPYGLSVRFHRHRFPIQM